MKTRYFEHVSDSTWGSQDEKPQLPKRSTAHSAGYDIFTRYGFTLEPMESIILKTGFKIFMQPDEYFLIAPRSGMGVKFFSRIANTIGIIDSDFYNNINNEGHVMIKLRNEGTVPMMVANNTAIAQGIFQKFLLIDDDDVTTIREGGLGHTTKN